MLSSRTCIHTLPVTCHVEFDLKGLIKVQKHMVLPRGVSKIFLAYIIFFFSKSHRNHVLPSPLIPCSPIDTTLFFYVSGNQTLMLMMQTPVLTGFYFSARTEGQKKLPRIWTDFFVVSCPEPRPRNVLDGMT